jgi:branched-chain amino acid transport system substrate-binding protein
VKVGSVGTYSGPVGGVMVPVLRGAQVWVKYINNKGGLNGHPVHLSVYDDGGDPARHRAATQQAVEADHVMAFLANGEPVTGASKVEYLNAKRVPVVGVAGGETWAYSSPMYFPQAPTGQAIVETFALGSGRYAVPRGKTRFGTLTCAEVPDCPKLEQAFAKHEKSSGYQYVYKGRASLAQPDFTAECLAARNAGVELLSLLMDSGSQNRIGVSCARQGYFPMYQIPAAAVRDEIKGNPNFDGALAILSTFPYFQSGTPATDEYQEAMRSFGQGALLGPGMAVGWVAGKLFEKAAGDLPEPPTTAALLAGLWRIHGDTLGGLTYPLNFIENQPPKLVACWFNMVVQKSKWVSPDEYRLNCE